MLRARFRIVLITIFASALAASCRGAPYPDDLWLQHVPTLLGLVVVAWTASKCRWSTYAFALAIAFLTLHVVAARYCYVAVPYDEWGRAATGVSLHTTLGWTRNHFDRLVHLCYGLFITLPASETLRQAFPIGRWASLFLSLVFILASSALYEIAEWIVAIVMAPDAADRFNGQQGDPWDAQKDMALAAIGALAALLVIVITERSDRPAKQKSLALDPAWRPAEQS
jgi:putative membrane protein